MLGETKKTGAGMVLPLYYEVPPRVVVAAQHSSPLSAPTVRGEVPAAPPPSSLLHPPSASTSPDDNQSDALPQGGTEDEDPIPIYVAKHVFCPRCGANLGWVGSSWYCFTCKFKEGCCDGEVGEDY